MEADYAWLTKVTSVQVSSITTTGKNPIANIHWIITKNILLHNIVIPKSEVKEHENNTLTFGLQVGILQKINIWVSTQKNWRKLSF